MRVSRRACSCIHDLLRDASNVTGRIEILYARRGLFIVRLLVVAMANSVHTARALELLRGTAWDVHLFPVEEVGYHAELRDVTIHDFLRARPADLDASVKLRGSWPFSRGAGVAQRVCRRLVPGVDDRAWRLARVVDELEPHVVHSLEFQHSAYLTLRARSHVKGRFPPWIVTNWGSDIQVFGALEEHRGPIRDVLALCDFYASECERDVRLAEAWGLKGRALPVVPNTGGLRTHRLVAMRTPGPPSARRVVAVKGYQGWAGRAFVALRALELCAEELRGYKVTIYSANPDVSLAAALKSRATGIPFEILGHSPHDEVLRLHGSARISIGLSIGDAISTSLLEAMAMGSFPIQSDSSCAEEWITHGRSGFVVPAEDPAAVAGALKAALADDAMVDLAARVNEQTIQSRASWDIVRPQVLDMYEAAASLGRDAA